MARDYAVYKGDEFICLGTAEECAKRLKVKPDTVRYYSKPAYFRKLEKRGKSKSALVALVLEDE
jgi:hypothetical protein